jgi:hypothetical protein
MATQTNYYCSNCDNLPVCKNTHLIVDFDNTIKEFNTKNSGLPVRISIASINYVCRYKDQIIVTP